MTLPLPLWDPNDPSSLQPILDLIAEATPDAGGRQLKFRVGAATMHFAGAANSDSLTVTHGMGSTPVAVLCMADAPSANITTAVVVNTVASPTSTTFTIKGHVANGAAVGPGDIGIYWLAVG